MPFNSSNRQFGIGLWCLLIVTVAFPALFYHRKCGDSLIRIKLNATNFDENCIIAATLPAPEGRFPVVIISRDFDAALSKREDLLTQIAELGMAAVVLDTPAKEDSRRSLQMEALWSFVQKQPWVLPNALGFIEFKTGIASNVKFLERHKDIAVRVFVELQQSDSNNVNQIIPLTNSTVLWVQPHDAEPRSQERLLNANILGEQEILRFCESEGGKNRAIAEYFKRKLPTPNFAGGFLNHGLSKNAENSFNVAIIRSGKNRDELLKSVRTLHDAERKMVMQLIATLEDYDLANISAIQLTAIVRHISELRIRYPWCRNTPDEFLSKFTASPRLFEVPLDQFHTEFYPRLEREIKYCKDTADASNTILHWMHRRTMFDRGAVPSDICPRETLSLGKGGCFELVALYTALTRSAGICSRPSFTFWQQLDGNHAWTEIWDSEHSEWRAVDSSAGDRDFYCDWMRLRAKPVIYAPSGSPGAWNASTEGRFEAYQNTISNFYPSGLLNVRILKAGVPADGKLVAIEMQRKSGFIRVARGTTDPNGEVKFTLGESSERPTKIYYRAVILGTSKFSDWILLKRKSVTNVLLNLKKEDDPPLEGYSAHLN